MLKLGIVTISYNQADFLPKALGSVQTRDFSKLSYVIVDSGSIDGSRDVILKFKNQSQRPKIIFEADKGPSDGLNKGFENVGDVDILGYINSDDYYAPGALDYVSDFFVKHPDVDVLTGAIGIVDIHGKVKTRGRISDRLNLTAFGAGCCLICQQATFFKKEAFMKIGGFNTDNKTCWDYELVVDLALQGFRFKNIPKVLGYFRCYDTSITALYQKNKAEQYLKDWSRIKHKIRNSGIYQYPSFSEPMLQFLYRLNIVRQLQWILVR
jgi:glycosyltransferase involved in cell wall biosynthesis